MRQEPYFLFERFETFLSLPDDVVVGRLSKGHLQSHVTLDASQLGAWREEIRVLRELLPSFVGRGRVLMEYSIPRMGHRIDVVLLIDGIVFVLEFKVGSDQYHKMDLLQAWDYALDLQNFHFESHHRTIVPLVIATKAEEIEQDMKMFREGMFYPLSATTTNLRTVIDCVLQHCPVADNYSDDAWAKSRYVPTPTIVEAARALYMNHSVADISRSDAAAENMTVTTRFVDETITWAKENHQKAICFVTGVPGAGKTLVGLNTATQQFARGELAVYLSGNFPLVEVLTEALTRDKVKHERACGQRMTKGFARNEVKTFIQMIHHYRDACLTGARITPDDIVKDESYFQGEQNQDKCFAPVDHVAIFDEAQRAWTRQQLANFMSRKKGIPDFPMSEPEYLISCLDRHQDWAVIICLVGGGQEINTGEAGIEEWIRALNSRFAHWHVFVSDRLVDEEYAAGKALEMLQKAGRPQLVKFEPTLHLAVSLRSFRAENLSRFIQNLLNLLLWTK